jgi:anti-sigma-K factor RskA
MTHDELAESIPLLALDALPGAERDALRRHVATCRSCRQLLAQYEQVTDALLADVPPAPPPAGLEQRLRQRIAGVSQVRAPQAGRSVPRALPRWAWAGAALALLVVLIGLALLLRAPEGKPEDSEVAKMLQTPGTVRVSIKGTDRSPNSIGEAIVNPISPVGYLLVDNLSALPEKQVYQVWLFRSSDKDSAALFTVDDKGHAAVHLWAPRALNAYQEMGVTVEPLGGSPWPTTPRVINGTLAH